MVIMEPVQNAGGAFTPPAGYWAGVREICDRYGILLCADEVITGYGRLGEWFGSELYDIRPDIVTCAKGLSSAYASIGAVLTTDAVMEPFLGGTRHVHARDHVRRRARCRPRSRSRTSRSCSARRSSSTSPSEEERVPATLEQLLDLPIVGDLRGTGFFYALELVKDKETRETFTDDECEELLRGFLSPALFERGLICRADDRGDPVIQISPPLVATPGGVRRDDGHSRRRARPRPGAAWTARGRAQPKAVEAPVVRG